MRNKSRAPKDQSASLLRFMAECCVIVVTHDLSIADKADEVLRLKDGELIEHESTISK